MGWQVEICNAQDSGKIAYRINCGELYAYVEASRLGLTETPSGFLFSFYLNKMFIPSHMQGQGLASALLEAIKKEINQRDVALMVNTSDISSSNQEVVTEWYEKNGFVAASPEHREIGILWYNI